MPQLKRITVEEIGSILMVDGKEALVANADVYKNKPRPMLVRMHTDGIILKLADETSYGQYIIVKYDGDGTPVYTSCGGLRFIPKDGNTQKYYNNLCEQLKEHGLYTINES